MIHTVFAAGFNPPWIALVKPPKVRLEPKLLAFLRTHKPMRLVDIAHASGMKRDSMWHPLMRLIADGSVVKNDGVYSIK